MFPADTEKTQAPIDRSECNEKVHENSYLRGGGQLSRAMSDSEILTKLFLYHPPTLDALPKYAAINQAAKNFAEVFLQNCPRSADRSAAIRLIREARMTANASIALDGLSL